MKYVFRTIVLHLRQQLEWRSALATMLILGLFLAVNSVLHFETLLRQLPLSWPLRVLVFALLYAAVLGSALGSQAMFDINFRVSEPWKYAIFLAVFLLLYAIMMEFSGLETLAHFIEGSARQNNVFYYIYRILTNLQGFVLFAIPSVLIYRFWPVGTAPYFGLGWSWWHARPYLLLVLLMWPLLIAASYQESFQLVYPRYRDYGEYQFLGLARWQTILGYEITYGFSFLTVELIMRGVFVIGAARFLGEKALLPMAALYVSMHFGKPTGEAISSFFGGYILGILALKSGNIYGGVITHVGVAWSMEILSFWQKGW
ncbi:MAG: hypothetical protein RIS47_817 [Bacteroidota bacterium]|jgi:hypothetical protein